MPAEETGISTDRIRDAPLAGTSPQDFIDFFTSVKRGFALIVQRVRRPRREALRRSVEN
jgi:hypothetical protein